VINTAGLIMGGHEAISGLILKSALFARVSKDGRESSVASILRDAAKPPLLKDEVRDIFKTPVAEALLHVDTPCGVGEKAP